MKTLKDIEFLEGVKVLVRADFNVPIQNGKVADDYRIRCAFPTIDFLISKGAKVILMSHLEANDGSNGSLEPIAEYLQKAGKPVAFLKDIKDAHAYVENTLKNGECVLLENLRMFGDGEKKNDAKFAEGLASLGDIYVNEAFPVSHRAHASVVGIPEFIPSYAGMQFEKEVSHLSRAFSPAHPFLFILGGAKFETKLPLVQRFSKEADAVFIGGALANDALKAKGYSVGKSKVSDGAVDLSKIVALPNVLMPADVVNQNHETKMIDAISAEDAILDAGPKTIGLLKEKATQAKFILWNGPLGMYENGFKEATLDLARIIGDATARGAETIVGGGDTVAAIQTLGAAEKFTFISTGGGAMLDFLATGTLPGIEALEKSEA